MKQDSELLIVKHHFIGRKSNDKFTVRFTKSYLINLQFIHDYYTLQSKISKQIHDQSKKLICASTKNIATIDELGD